jgi:tetratricopeptide (TPR) repeat protein
LERTLELDPTFGGAHLRLAQICHRQRDVAGMQSHLRAELLLRPEDADLLRDLADLLLDTGDARAAVACLRRQVQVDEGDCKAWQNLGVAQFLIGRYADGIASSRQALRRDPRNTAAMHNIALAYCHLKQYPRAMLWTRRGMRLSPRDRSLRALHLRLVFLRMAKRIRAWMGK